MKIKLPILLIILSWGLFGCQEATKPVATEFSPSTNLTSDEETMVFGVFPYLSPARLEAGWSPVAAEFNRSSNVKLQFRTANDFAEFNDNLNASSYDIALIQPFEYIKIPPNTYEPLVKFNEPLSGIFVVRTDSNIKNLTELAGKTVATPPETAAVTILAQITLDNIGVEDVTYAYQDSHDQCLQLLLIAEVDACVTNTVPLRAFEESLDLKFTILDNTLEIPHALIIVHNQTPNQQKENLKNFFLGLNSSETGQQLLLTLGVNGFDEAKDSDYNIVRNYMQEQQP